MIAKAIITITQEKEDRVELEFDFQPQIFNDPKEVPMCHVLANYVRKCLDDFMKEKGAVSVFGPIEVNKDVLN